MGVSGTEFGWVVVGREVVKVMNIKDQVKTNTNITFSARKEEFRTRERKR